MDCLQHYVVKMCLLREVSKMLGIITKYTLYKPYYTTDITDSNNKLIMLLHN